MSTALESVWFPCPTCWGQRRLLRRAPGDDHLIGETCPSCLGVGEQHAPVADPRARRY
ncbi:MAG: hypothetical protein MUE51_14880 [Thermoleophilia bacterium]|jgi:hypothetical protein|nr:hypothetical protein [Thermoleophilia bacterium]